MFTKNVITNVNKSVRKLSLRAYSVQLLKKKKELKTTRPVEEKGAQNYSPWTVLVIGTLIGVGFQKCC